MTTAVVWGQKSAPTAAPRSSMAERGTRTAEHTRNNRTEGDPHTVLEREPRDVVGVVSLSRGDLHQPVTDGGQNLQEHVDLARIRQTTRHRPTRRTNV